MKKAVAYFVAPYSPIGSEFVNLGAVKKIDALIRILRDLGFTVRLLNSAHNECKIRPSTIRRSSAGGVRLVEITPFSLPSRPLGKVFNMAFGWAIGRALSKSVWLYNGYAFECIFGLAFKNPGFLVMEIEDLPFSRRRGALEIKNRLDQFLLQKVLPKSNLITCVNTKIAENFASFGARKFVLPGLVSNASLVDLVRDPFSGHPYRVGYFGGLNEEKGAGCMLGLMNVLPRGWQVVVTGSGPLAHEFYSWAQHSDRLLFEENASDQRVRELMLSCDVLVNPHKPIVDMRSGVFPFKVYEFLSTGRLVITTQLPATPIDFSQAVELFDGTSQSLARILEQGHQLYADKKSAVLEVAQIVNERYSEAGLRQTLKDFGVVSMR